LMHGAREEKWVARWRLAAREYAQDVSVIRPGRRPRAGAALPPASGASLVFFQRGKEEKSATVTDRRYSGEMNWFFWALLSAFFAALTAILAKVGVADINSNLATAIRTTVILVFTWGIALATGGLPEIGVVAPRTWFFLVVSGLATGLSWLCYFRALQLGEVAKVAPVDKLSVVIAILLAVAFLGERLRPQEAVGAGLVVVGVIVMVARF
jgi:transporter family protein